jgi:hypothetical protein
MNQQMFDEHIGTPPPSTVDVDRIIHRQRRNDTLRRLTAGGSAAAATVLAIVVGVALTGGGRPDPATPAAVIAPTAAASASPSAAGIRLEVGDPQAMQRTQEKLRVALETAASNAAPGVTWIYMPDVPGEKPLPDGHPAMWTERNPVGFAARSGVTRSASKGGFYLWLRPAGCTGGRNPVVVACPDKSTEGTTSTTPAGLEVTETTEKSPAKGGKQYVFYGVQVKLRPDYYLSVLAVNYFGGDGSAVVAKTPVLTQAELKAVASAIADQIVA